MSFFSERSGHIIKHNDNNEAAAGNYISLINVFSHFRVCFYFTGSRVDCSVDYKEGNYNYGHNG